jgi:hypothetical protein
MMGLPLNSGYDNYEELLLAFNEAKYVGFLTILSLPPA